MSDTPSKGAGSPSVHMVLYCESEHDLDSRMSNLSSRKRTKQNSGLIKRASPPDIDQDYWPGRLHPVTQSWSLLHPGWPLPLVPFSFQVTREYGPRPMKTDQDYWLGWLLPKPYFVSLRGDVATAISRMFNPLIFFPKSLFSSGPH